MNYSFDGKTLTVNGREITFDLNVEKVLEKDEVLMVLLYGGGKQSTSKTYQSRNIFGLNADGEIIWQAEAPTKDPVDLYTDLLEEEGNIIGYARSGGDCYLDHRTGKILKKILVR